jgi:hypothetical protein
MKLVVPPSWEELLEDEIYASWIKRRPRLPENVSHGMPWMIVARRTSETPGATWAIKKMSSYEDAYHRVRKLLATHQYEDVAVVSRRMLFRPPIGFTWNTNRYSWCGRCRRPSIFTHAWTHFALRDAIVLAEIDTERCYYCGAREVFAGRMKPRKARNAVAV